jgi:hypothetical protein
MASLVAAAHCIGLSGKISIRRDFYGYWDGVPGPLSLLTQVRLLQGAHIHLNLIRAATFDLDHLKAIDFGLQLMRNIYATVNVGIGRILRYTIPPGREVVDGTSGAKHLWNDFSVRNDGIDVFLVATVGGDEAGWSPVGGSCDKDSKNDSGCVIGVAELTVIPGLDSGFYVGRAIAHEVGHFLGLVHEDDLPENLMYPDLTNGGTLYGGQVGVMVIHCSIRTGCQL